MTGAVTPGEKGLNVEAFRATRWDVGEGPDLLTRRTVAADLRLPEGSGVVLGGGDAGGDGGKYLYLRLR